MRRPYKVGVSVYRELGRELERHGESLAGLVRLALDELLADLPHLRELYHHHERRTPPISQKKLRIIERELVDRAEMLRAQRSARYLALFGDRICPMSVMNRRKKELRALREGIKD